MYAGCCPMFSQCTGPIPLTILQGRHTAWRVTDCQPGPAVITDICTSLLVAQAVCGLWVSHLWNGQVAATLEAKLEVESKSSLTL